MPIPQAIEMLLADTDDIDIPVFFDVTSLDAFRIWLRQNKPKRNLLLERINDGLELTVFTEQLKSVTGNRYEKWKQFLDNLQFTFDNSQWDRQYDELFTSELQTVYFHDERTDLSRGHAEFVVLARQNGRTLSKTRLLTVHSAFQRLLNAEIFLLSKPVSSELSANFDVLADIEIHQRLRSAIEGTFRSKDYPTVVFNAAKELSEYLRDVSGLPDDGITLVDRALDFSMKSSTEPTIKLNLFSTKSEKEEQKGYHYLCSGVAKAIRNPNAHLTSSDTFITSRFNNQKTAIKVLCFLSLLFEKIDASEKLKSQETEEENNAPT
jgi:uncharacterized protein (TIGR02391 family)